MADAKTVPKSYRVILKNGKHAIYRNDNNLPDYEDSLLSGVYGILDAYGETKITPDNILKVEIFTEPAGCEHCGHIFDLKNGENVCPKCSERTILHATKAS